MKKRDILIVPRAPFERILKLHGAPRVSDDAMELLCELCTERATEISAKAWSLCQHAGRKTVRAEDVRLAFESMK